MNRISNLVRSLFLVTLVFAVPSSAFGQLTAGRWIRETHAAYPDRDVADRVAQSINTGTVPGWRNASVNGPHAVTRDYAVTAERFEANTNPQQPAPQDVVVNGQLTKGDVKDRLRLNMHAKVYQFNFVAGRTYTIDLMSGDGKSGPHNPGFFDTWLRVEDGQGSIKAENDDGGDGLNSRVSFTPTVTGAYTVVVTSYASNTTGTFTLRIR